MELDNNIITENVENDPIFQEFLDNRNLSSGTVRTYTYHLNKYCFFTGMTPTELIEEAEAEEEARIRMRKRKIKQQLLGFKKWLENHDFSPSHISSAITAVRSFYTEFEIELPKARRRGLAKDKKLTFKDIPTKEDIREALKHSNLKYKAIILMQMSSGMRRCEVRHLTVQDFADSIQEYFRTPLRLPLNLDNIKAELFESNGIPTWNIVSCKTGMEYTTFSTPESVNAILDYLKEKPPESMEDPLFRNPRGGRISENAYVHYFAKLNKVCKFGKRGRTAFFKSHNLRKFFTSVLLQQGLSQMSIDWMLGHTIKDKTTEAYFLNDPEGHLKSEYLKVMDAVSLGPVEVRLFTDERLQKLEAELANEREKREILEDLLRDKGVIKELNKR